MAGLTIFLSKYFAAVEVKNCPNSQFQCASKTQCIDRRYRCDEKTDCSDSSDEDGCTSKYDERIDLKTRNQ